MQIDTQGYTRKPFRVDAIQVTESNMKHVAEWCGGTITEGKDSQFIKVDVHRPLNERQTKAFVNDWVLRSESGFKVYTEKAFANSFEQEPKDEVPSVNLSHDKDAVQAEAGKKTERFRDAGTGEFVTEEFAQANPETTVSETEFQAAMG